MPMFEYQCNACNHIFEEIAAQDETVSCPKCASEKTNRLVSACAHQGCRATLGNYSPSSISGGGGKCGGCAGGNCSSCH